LVIAIFMCCSGFAVASSMMDEQQFTNYVTRYLNNNYKNLNVVSSTEPLLVETDTGSFGLQNIFNRYKLEQYSTELLDAELEKHFTETISMLRGSKSAELESWGEARSLVRAQIAPVKYKEMFPIIYTALDEYTLITYVIDAPGGYRYVTHDDVKKWGVQKEELDNEAILNLDGISKNIPIHISLETDKLMMVQVMDGYDAARILLPAFRKFVESKLGSPFYAAIPNRDFLVMWSMKNTEQFNISTRSNVDGDFRSQPYPLSPNIFTVTENNIQTSE